MTGTRKRKKENEILFCCHSSWLDSYGFITIPENTYLYIYAPLGAALSQSIPRAIVSGEVIRKGDLTINRISPITLFNYGYEDRGELSGNYKKRDDELKDYPILYGPGDQIPNYSVSSPGKDRLVASNNSNISVQNIDNEEMHLEDLLQSNKGTTCHFGGCSWVRKDSDKRDIVTFKNPEMEEKFKVKLSEEEKRAKRAERFGKKI